MTQRVPLLHGLVGTELGKTAVIAAFLEGEAASWVMEEARTRGYRMVRGAVGSMQGEKVIAAIETAARREGLVDPSSYREEHALYHAVVEALHGIGRGQLLFGGMLRTVGLTFVVARGPRVASARGDGEWLAVVLYGTIGAPMKGFEHEALGLGVNHI